MSFDRDQYRARVYAHISWLVSVYKDNNPDRRADSMLLSVMDQFAGGHRPMTNAHWEISFNHIASLVLKFWYAFTPHGAQTTEAFDCHKFADLLTSKSERYGNTPLTRWGLLGVIIRIDSKVARLINLLNAHVDGGDESIEDTVVDILGYCVLARMMISKEIV